MNDFLDLKGASGATYRFRVWPKNAAHLPVAGNYVVLKAGADGFQVLLLGATHNLSLARADAAKVASLGPTHVFTRLNVARLTRFAEHEDLVAGHQPAAGSDGVS